MNINLIKLGIIHCNKEIETTPGFGSLTMGSKKDLKELIKFLDWCEEKRIDFLFGWRMVKINNDVGSYFYRLCPSLSVFKKEDVVLIRLVWPDIQVEIDEEEEQ